MQNLKDSYVGISPRQSQHFKKEGTNMYCHSELHGVTQNWPVLETKSDVEDNPGQ